MNIMLQLDGTTDLRSGINFSRSKQVSRLMIVQ